MISKRGFTLVEVVVVIAVIAILATLATVGFSRYLEDGRDNQRTANVTVISEALEKYYDENGEYPSCASITAPSSTVTSSILDGIDQAALLVPNADDETTNSIRCGSSLTISGEDFIEYVGDGSAACTGSGSCLSYTLRYKSEGDGEIKEVESRRTADIATSGAITNLNATATGFTTAELTWVAVQNATSYTLQRATDSGFTANLVTSTVTTNSSNVTGLTSGTEYFFRVAPVGGSQNGTWSNTATLEMHRLGSPSLTLTVNSTTQITANWSTVANANSSTRYTLQRATNSSFSANLTTVNNINGTSNVSTGLAVGQTYFYRVRAVAPDSTGDWSNTASSSTTPNAPTNVAATVNSSTQITVSWTTQSGATSYRITYGTSSAANSSTKTSTGSSVAIGSLAQGSTYYFKVYSVASGGAESVASSTVNATTTIDTPGPYNMSSWVSGGLSDWFNGSSPVNCPAGTTAYFHWYANGGFWVGGSQHRQVGYYLNPGQGVTLQVATRCYKGSVSSGWRWSSNNAGYTRPGMNLSLWLGNDGCSGGFCGREVYSGWNNVCGTGAPRIYARQYSAYANWIADSATGDVIRWKGASGAGVWVDYYDINIGCTSAARSIQVPSAYKCRGCS